MMKRYRINSTRWAAITSAGQSGSCWIVENARGNGLIFISHSDSGLPKRGGFKLKGITSNNPLIISADNVNDIYYARVGKAKNIIRIEVDVS